MNADELFENAVKTYNIWYKIFDKKNYTMQSYKLFEKAKNIYLSNKNNNRIKSCYEWMIQCLRDIPDDNLYTDDLANIYDEYAFFLFYTNEIDKAIVYFSKAIDMYHDLEYTHKIIGIKELLAEYYAKNNYDIAISLYKELKSLYISHYKTKHFTLYRINKSLFELYIRNSDFISASQIYDVPNINDEIINKYVYEEMISNSILCFAYIDVLLAKKKLEVFVHKFPEFKDKKENLLLLELLDHIENSDLEALDSLDISNLEPIGQFIIDKMKREFGAFSRNIC